MDSIESIDMGPVFPDSITRYVRDAAAANLGNRDYVKQVLAGKTAVSDVLISRAAGKPVVMFAAPVFRDDTKNSSVLGIAVTPQRRSCFKMIYTI